VITLCWGAKGGCGTTTIAAMLALSGRGPTLLVDLAGDAALALGLGVDGLPTLNDWFGSTASADRLRRLERDVSADLRLLPSSAPIGRSRSDSRWTEFGAALRESADRDVVIDAGSGEPPGQLVEVADRRLLIVRPCYLALMHAFALTTRPSGVILVDEPGRVLRADDVELSLGAPLVARVPYDPKIARAIDSGLMVSRFPTASLHELRATA